MPSIRAFTSPFRLAALLAAGLACSAGAELVYANTNQFFPPRVYQFTNAYTVDVPNSAVPVPAGQVGDSVRLTRGGEFERFRFQYSAFGAVDAASLVLRFYENNGPEVQAPGFGTVRLPGTLIFQSDPFAIQEGTIVVMLENLPGLILPESVTWSVEYRNLDFANSAFGLVAYSPPQIGSNPDYYLTLDGSRNWLLNPPAIQGGVTIPGNFPATFEFVPIPEPGVATLAGLGVAAFLLHSRRSRTRRRE